MYKTILIAGVLMAENPLPPPDPYVDPLNSNRPLILIPGCVSTMVVDEENKTVTVYKRERQCKGETPREKADEASK